MKYSKYFQTKTRDNGKTFTCLKDDAPEALQEFIQEAHDGMLPDDWRYQFILDAFQAIEDHDSIDDARESIEASIYNRDLIDWLGSHGDRQSYCDDAIGEYGIDTAKASIIGLISWGQYKERIECFDYVASFIEEQENEEN